jgi:hypothetical protein
MPQWENKMPGKRAGQPKLSIQQRKRNCTIKKKKHRSKCPNAQAPSQTSHDQERSLQEVFYLSLNTQVSPPYTNTNAKSRGREENGEGTVRE